MLVQTSGNAFWVINPTACTVVLYSFIIVSVSGDPFEGERTRLLFNILLFWYNSFFLKLGRGDCLPESAKSWIINQIHPPCTSSAFPWSTAVKIELATWWDSLVSNLRYLNITGWSYLPLLPFVSLGWGQQGRRGTKPSGWSIYLSIRRNSIRTFCFVEKY